MNLFYPRIDRIYTDYRIFGFGYGLKICVNLRNLRIKSLESNFLLIHSPPNSTSRNSSCLISSHFKLSSRTSDDTSQDSSARALNSE